MLVGRSSKMAISRQLSAFVLLLVSLGVLFVSSSWRNLRHQKAAILPHDDSDRRMLDVVVVESNVTKTALKAELLPFSSFPSVDNSTVLFLHVFKCAGTSLREVLMTWAESEGLSGSIASACTSISKASKKQVCLEPGSILMDPEEQLENIRGSKMVAGHFFWDFRQYVRKPYLLFTTLRNPLELFISGQQFKHRDKTKTLEAATEHCMAAMSSALRRSPYPSAGFIRRFVDGRAGIDFAINGTYTQEEIGFLAASSVENLNTFWLVGVVEQYEGFLEVLKNMLDPELKHPRVWAKAQHIGNNKSPVTSWDVLDNIDADLVSNFNETVFGLQWEVYSVGLQLWDQRCRQVLPIQAHEKLCSVPR